jgi:hypothetical protein
MIGLTIRVKSRLFHGSSITALTLVVHEDLPSPKEWLCPGAIKKFKLATAAVGRLNADLIVNGRLARADLNVLKVTAIPAFNDNYLWLIHAPRDAQRVAVVDPGDATAVLETLQLNQLTLSGILSRTTMPTMLAECWNCCRGIRLRYSALRERTFPATHVG